MQRHNPRKSLKRAGYLFMCAQQNAQSPVPAKSMRRLACVVASGIVPAIASVIGLPASSSFSQLCAMYAQPLLVLLASVSVRWCDFRTATTSQLLPMLQSAVVWSVLFACQLIASVARGPVSFGLLLFGVLMVSAAVGLSYAQPAFQTRIVRRPTELAALLLICGCCCINGHLPAAAVAFLTCVVHAYALDMQERNAQIAAGAEQSVMQYTAQVSCILPFRSAIVSISRSSAFTFWLLAFSVEALCSLSKGPLAPEHKAMAPQAELVSIISNDNR